ncbi:LIM domain-containing protein [Phthorimaea operculella]|nr:LIM domain-containing protein [Phthorimaea operculella]
MLSSSGISLDTSIATMSLDNMFCTRCGDGFEPNEKIVNSNGELWHTNCFVCAQCFRVFPDGVFYEFEGRKYCERDFQVLFAPCCGKCGEFIIGRVIKAMNANWHPACFRCEECNVELADAGFIKHAGRALCHACNARVKADGLQNYMCHKCHGVIDGEPLRYRGEVYHGYHFTCATCGVELDHSAREVKHRPGYAANDVNGVLVILTPGFIGSLNDSVSHTRRERVRDCLIPLRYRGEVYHGYHFTCATCGVELDHSAREVKHRPGYAANDVVYHGYHFTCATCGVELDHSAREVKHRPGYAANDVNNLFCLRCHDKMGIPICGACRRPIEERIVTALGKHWHVEHFVCAKCEKPFHGHRHYEKKGLAYCEQHYHQLFGNLCYVCNQVIAGDVFTALNKAWCVHHFACSVCDSPLSTRSKFYEYDERPACRRCYEKFPQELRRRLRRAHHYTVRR